MKPAKTLHYAVNEKRKHKPAYESGPAGTLHSFLYAHNVRLSCVEAQIIQKQALEDTIRNINSITAYFCSTQYQMNIETILNIIKHIETRKYRNSAFHVKSCIRITVILLSCRYAVYFLLHLVYCMENCIFDLETVTRYLKTRINAVPGQTNQGLLTSIL